MKSEPQRSRPTPIAGIIVTHADLAEAFRVAAARVAGDDSRIETVSNEGLSPEQLSSQVLEAVERLQGDECIVFVDFRGGSCANACVAALQRFPNVRVISGVNLPMIVDFVLRRGDQELDAMVERLLDRGRNAVQTLKGKP